jgi:AraC family transcriptional regulator
MSDVALKSSFELLNVDCVRLNKSWNYQNIISPFYRLYLLEEGEGLLSDSVGVTTMKPGYLYLVPSYTLCSYSCEDRMVQYYLQFIEESPDGNSLFAMNRTVLQAPVQDGDPEMIHRLLALNPDRGLPQHNPKYYQERPVIQQFKEHNRLLSLSSYVETKGILLQLVSRFLTDEIFKSGEHRPVPSAVLKTIRYIQTHLSESITVAELAREQQLNPDYLSRIFLEHTGERPLNYIQLKRVEHAQFLMLTTVFSLTEIAIECGFDSLSYFSRIFKKVVGRTPGEYKSQARSI